MTEKEKNDKNDSKYPSTFTVDCFSSTTKLPIGSVETINEKEYNPFDHRVGEHQNSSVGALVHLVKSSLGSGILAMPHAFLSGGAIFSFVGTIIIGILCTHCVHILVKASHEMSRRKKVPSLAFAETAEAVFEYGPEKIRKFSHTAKVAVNIGLVVTYFLGNSVYIVLIASSLSEVVTYHNGGVELMDKRLYMLIILVPIILTSQFRQLRHLVPFSLLANICMIVSFIITLYFIFEGFEVSKDVEFLGSIDTIPSFFSTVIFAMEGIGVVMPVENSMDKPQQFLGCPGVLNIAMSLVVSLYAIIGLFGYLKYGGITSTNITSVLPNTPLGDTAKLCIAISVFFTFSLQFHVPMEITWQKVCEPYIPKKFHNLGQVAVRSLVCAVICCIAIGVPELDPIISLVGAICLSTLGILVPAFVETVLRWEGRLGLLKWVLIKNIFLMCFSLFALCAGTYYAILKIIELY
ncbi:PREDICTED: proton-coupled amino acid transporter-like protein pathetic [Nicrophorus vespilloides]|uniref:Proton-coupled amino acid transporter-like protein pathetic n=1 Tax=Nicrophorus vespilloides TaxID=110193 RepID=A0ABM1MVE8_NICVS|nr:PREDICTED: proton-coupled amino acid transporter-like protein pathetic [Nicrophorus vespilloides]